MTEHRPAVHSSYVERNIKRGWSPDRDEHVAEMWRDGATIAAIAKDLGVSENRARDIVQRLILRRVVQKRARL